MTAYKAWRVHEAEGRFQGDIERCNTEDLPAGDVLIEVTHSSLNYKDALSATGNKGVTRNYPHTPGIDAAGTILASDAPDWSPGDPVIVTGYDLGMNTAGGFGERIRVPAGWCVRMPDGWNAQAAMSYGTAGLTAALSVEKLLRMGIDSSEHPVLVTGASGGVGSVAVALLDKLGYSVTAMTGKPGEAERLQSLGARDVIDRSLLAPEKRPLQKPRFAAVIDTVGGGPLAEALKWLVPGGSATTCGMVGGVALETSVFPFILRGVNLLGVDSVEIPREHKQAVWKRLASDWRCPGIEEKARVIGLDELAPALQDFIDGNAIGRVVLAHQH